MKTFEVFHASDHIARCNTAARTSPEALFRIIFLANGSIRIKSDQFWQNILPTAYISYIRFNRDIEKTSRHHKNFAVMKFKAECIRFAERHKYSIHRAFRLLSEEKFYLWLVKNVPGLGFTKAAFVSQMANGYLGCLDTVNIQRFGLNPRIRTVKKYLEAYKTTGETSHEMWYNWCQSVAQRDGMQAEKLSEAHALFVENGTYPPKSL